MLFCRFCVIRHWRTGTDQMAIAVDIVDAIDLPILINAKGTCRITSLSRRRGEPNHLQVFDSMWCILQRVCLRINLSRSISAISRLIPNIASQKRSTRLWFPIIGSTISLSSGQLIVGAENHNPPNVLQYPLQLRLRTLQKGARLRCIHGRRGPMVPCKGYQRSLSAARQCSWHLK